MTNDHRTREDIIHSALEAINGDRHRDYGSAIENFQRIASGWSEIFGHRVTMAQVALAMDWVKSSRLIKTPSHTDSWIDKCGYSALGGELATKDE